MIEKLTILEDKLLKQVGLYTLWTVLYIWNIVALCTDSTEGNVRTFNLVTCLASHIYVAFAGMNQIYGNQMPSTVLVTAGPLHQYSFWILLSYFRGDVYSRSAVGVLNTVYTCIVGVFTLDMVIKSWYITLYPDTYLDYVKQSKSLETDEEGV